jgi:hypothetical protein
VFFLESKALALGVFLESKALALGVFLESKALALGVFFGVQSFRCFFWSPE